MVKTIAQIAPLEISVNNLVAEELSAVKRLKMDASEAVISREGGTEAVTLAPGLVNVAANLIRLEGNVQLTDTVFSADQDVVSKLYVDDLVSSLAPVASTGDLTSGSLVISGSLSFPSVPQDATTVFASTFHNSNASFAPTLAFSAGTNTNSWLCQNSQYALDGSYIGTKTTNSVPGEWLTLDLGSTQVVLSFDITATNSVANLPALYSLFGSPDNVTWNLIDDGTLPTAMGNVALNVPVVGGASVPSRYIRLVGRSIGSRTGGNTYLQIKELAYNVAVENASIASNGDFHTQGVVSVGSGGRILEDSNGFVLESSAGESNLILSSNSVRVGAPNVVVSEPQIDMTSAIDGGYTATQSGVYAGNTNLGAYRMFSDDGNSTDRFGAFYPSYSAGLPTRGIVTVIDGQSYHGEWGQLETPVGRQITSFTLDPHQANPTWTLSKWVLAYSSDGLTWQMAFDQSASHYIFSPSTPSVLFDLPVHVSARFWRIVVTEVGQGAQSGFTNFDIEALRLHWLQPCPIELVVCGDVSVHGNLDLRGGTIENASNLNPILAVTELSSASLFLPVTHTVQTAGSLFRAINLASDGIPRYARVQFVAPQSGNVVLSCSYTLLVSGASSHVHVGLHNSSTATSTPLNGYQTTFADHDGKPSSYHSEFILRGLTPGDVVERYVMCVSAFPGGAFQAGHTGMSTLLGNRPGPFIVKVTDIGSVSVNPAS